MERKTAFISGASRGIGEAIAITLSKEYNVIINYAHSEEGARAVLAQCDPEGHHKMIQCDISDGEQVKAMLEEIVKDADVLDFYQYGYNMARKEQQDRLESLLGHKVEGLKFSEK